MTGFDILLTVKYFYILKALEYHFEGIISEYLSGPSESANYTSCF